MRYECVKIVQVKGAAPIEIYRRVRLHSRSMIVPFIKAHGAKNDFLLTWASEAPRTNLADRSDRHL